MKKSEWKNKIEQALSDKPLVIGDLIDELGFSLQSTTLDLFTRVNGLKSLSGSFVDSKAQKALAEMVQDGEVYYQKAANCDNWYKLPHQEFPKESAPRKQGELKRIMKEVLSLFFKERIQYYDEMEYGPDDWGAERAKTYNEWKNNVEALENDDHWVEFCPFVFSMKDDGWELADGDPICNWCGNTFTKKFPIDVKAIDIVNRMEKKFADDKKHFEEYEEKKRKKEAVLSKLSKEERAILES